MIQTPYMLNWNFFKSKFEGKEEAAFQNLAYFLFCHETKQEVGIFEYYNQVGIETEPVEFQGRTVGFQAKFYEQLRGKGKDIKDSIDAAIRKNTKLQDFYLYLNKSFGESKKSDSKKPVFQANIEEYAKAKGINIVWRVPSNIDYLLAQEECDYVRKMFFDEWDAPELIIQKFSSFNDSLMSYRSTTNNEEYQRKELQELISFATNEQEAPLSLLVGDAGMGKSVLTKQLVSWLYKNSIPTLAIKSDYNQFNSINDLETRLGLKYCLIDTLKFLVKAYGKVVIIIDQIDALSQTLSKDRSQIELYRHLIEHFIKTKGVKVIVSCREYDLNYDAFLQPLTKYGTISVGKLDSVQIQNVLKPIGIVYDNLDELTQRLLLVPLNLSLYCDVYEESDDNNVGSIGELYDKLWSKHIKVGSSNLSSMEIQSALTDIASMMYDRQELTINTNILEDKHGKVISYLVSSGIIKKVGNSKITFFHQSFFDYVYARSYVNGGKHLYQDIKEQHQGFFIRSRVKQVLEYLRATNANEYIKNLKQILSDKGYCFHLQYLVINLLTFQTNLLDAEKKLFVREIKNNELYYKIFLDSLWSGEWLNYIIERGYVSELFDNENKDLIDKLLSVAYRRTNTSEPILCLLNLAISSKYSYKYEFVSTLLCNIDITTNCGEYHKIFNGTYDNWESSWVFQYLRKTAKFDSAFTIAKLKEIVIKHYNEPIQDLLHFNYIPNTSDFHLVLERLQKKDVPEWTAFLMWLIDFVVRHTIFDYSVTKRLKSSHALYTYAPGEEIHHVDGIKVYYRQLIQQLTIISQNNPERIVEYLRNCRESQIECLIALSAICYSQNVTFFNKDICNLLTNKNIYYGYSWLSYNVVSLLSVSFSVLDGKTQNTIFDILSKVHPSWESLRTVKFNTLYGRTAYKYLYAIPKDLIEKSSCRSLYRELYNKFGEIENESPTGVQIHVGDPALPKVAYENMSDKDLKHSFLKITSNNHSFDWDKPTMCGHAQAFGQIVESNPQRYAKLIYEISDDVRYNVIYSIHGCEGLYKGKYDGVVVSKIIEKIIERIKDDKENSSIILNAIEYVISKDCLTPKIFNYIYSLAYNRKSEYDNEDNQFDNTKEINHFSICPRGHAAICLIRAHAKKEYVDQIFSALFKIAEDGNISTRVAVIYYMVELQNVDIKRNIELYFKIHEYGIEQLCLIPISDRHPLPYMIAYDFEIFISYFNKLMTIEGAGSQLKSILFISWLRGYEQSKLLLQQSLSQNLDGIQKAYQIAVGCFDDDKMKLKAFDFVMHCLDYKNEELRKSIESLMGNAITKLKNDKELLTQYIEKCVSGVNDCSRCRKLYVFLKEMASDNPEWTLKILSKLNKRKNLDNDSFFIEDIMCEIIIIAYNSISIFDKEDENLNFAISLFDDLLKKGKLGYRAFQFLNDTKL